MTLSPAPITGEIAREAAASTFGRLAPQTAAILGRHGPLCPSHKDWWANGYSTHLRRFWSFWGRYTLYTWQKSMTVLQFAPKTYSYAWVGVRGSWCPPVFHTPISAAQPRSVRPGRGGGRAGLGSSLTLRPAHPPQPRPIQGARLRPSPILTCHRPVTCHFRPVFAPVPRLSPWARLGHA